MEGVSCSFVQLSGKLINIGNCESKNGIFSTEKRPGLGKHSYSLTPYLAHF